jgi:hypothetical protein
MRVLGLFRADLFPADGFLVATATASRSVVWQLRLVWPTFGQTEPDSTRTIGHVIPTCSTSFGDLR